MEFFLFNEDQCCPRFILTVLLPRSLGCACSNRPLTFRCFVDQVKAIEDRRTQQNDEVADSKDAGGKVSVLFVVIRMVSFVECRANW
jgi:hypothetical protein